MGEHRQIQFYKEAILIIEWRMARIGGQDRRPIMTSVTSGKPGGDGLNSGSIRGRAINLSTCSY